MWTDLDPGYQALIISVGLSLTGVTWAWWSHRRFIRKWGPPPE